MASATERALGKLLHKHRTDNRRRGRTALRSGIVGVVLVGAAVVTFLVGVPPYVGAVLLVVGLLGLWRAVVYGRAWRRLGGEVFMVREKGLIYRRAGTTTAVAWEDVEAVHVRQRDRGGLLGRLVGHDVVCRVTLRRAKGGLTALRVTGFTHDARALGETIAAHVRGEVTSQPARGGRGRARTLSRAG